MLKVESLEIPQPRELKVGDKVFDDALRLILSVLFDVHPELQIILGHLGEGLPYVLPRMQHRLDKQREGDRRTRARHRASTYFARNFLLTTGGHFTCDLSGGA